MPRSSLALRFFLIVSLFLGFFLFAQGSDIFDALSYGEEERVKRVLGSNPRAANQISADGEMTALMAAIDTMKPKIVRLFLLAKADPNLKIPGQGKTALMFLMERYYLRTERDASGVSKVTDDPNGMEILQLLLQAGAKATDKDNEGKSVLSYAISSREAGTSQKLLEILLKASADPKVNFTNDTKRPICLVAMEPNFGIDPETIRILTRLKGCDPKKSYDVERDLRSTPLYLAIKNKDPETVRILLEYGADPNQGASDSMFEYHPFFEDVCNPALSYTLLEFGANPNAIQNGVHIFEHIARTCSDEDNAIKLITTLVQKGGNVNHPLLFDSYQEENKAVQASEKQGRKKIANFLRAKGALTRTESQRKKRTK